MEESRALAALGALAQPMRMAVFRALVRAGNTGMIAGEIGAAVAAPPSTLSANVAILARAGLVTAAREGRAIRYRADMEGFRALMAYLLEDCCGGRPELCRPVLAALACEPVGQP